MKIASVFRSLPILLLLFFTAFPLQGYDNTPEIRIMTLGQGDPVYIWFGHTAIITDDPYEPPPLLYDYGVFDFRQDNFFLNFAMGRLIYSKIVSPAQNHEYLARRDLRNMRIITLNLPGEVRQDISDFLAREVLPENNTYLYHHYYDNCATRIRDIIDDALEGQFKQWAQAQPGRMTLREHFSRHSRSSYPMLWLLNFLQGSRIDTPITRWDEMFLPSELEQAILDFSYTDNQGTLIPLASSREVVTQFAQRPVVSDTWEPVWPAALVIGIMLAGIVTFLKHLAEGGRKSALQIYAASQSLLGLFFGILGVVLLFMMIFTDHDVTRDNLNIFMINPLWLLAVYYGIALARGKKTYRKHLLLFWRIIGILSLVSIVIRVFMTYPQGNQITMALILPLVFIQGQWWKLRLTGGRTH